VLEALSVIDTVEGQPLLVSWDLGRRCNYDCTYCPSHRHDNHSPHASLEDLQNAARFMFRYLELIMPLKTMRFVSVSFTGGEPTVNPHIIEFGLWLRREHEEKYKSIYTLNLSFTSNGATSRAMCDNLIENYNFATISYHCEAHERLKQMSVDNILYLFDKKFAVNVNVMFHAREDYFNECIALCEKLAGHGVDYTPRLIGEHDDNNRYHHKYTDTQMQWMKDFWQRSKKKLNDKCESKTEAASIEAPKAKPEGNTARSLGRPCCAKRELKTCSTSTGWERTNFIQNARFKDWYCSVNWFFLHIEQQTGHVYHHQTCQANFGGKREPMGTLAESGKILANLERHIEARTMPIIVCPNKICGCGLCTPKAVNLDDLKAVLPTHVDTRVFENNPEYHRPAATV